MSGESLPELGSTEAAVRSYVNLFCRATGLQEDVTAYWLDCYYQLRAMHEEAQAARPAPPPVISQIPKFYPPVKTEGLTDEEAGKKEVSAGREFKQDVLSRIAAYKAAGVTYGMMVNSCESAFGMGLLLDAVNCVSLSERQWKALDRGLKKVAKVHAEILSRKEPENHV